LEKDTESICLRGDKDLVIKESETAKVVVLNEAVQSFSFLNPYALDSKKIKFLYLTGEKPHSFNGH